MNARDWYAQLTKPSWAPPSWLFGSVWTLLYVLITLSFGAVFYMAEQQQVVLLVTVPFVLNLVFNFAFTPIQFRLRNNHLALLDIVLILGTLIWAMVAIYPYASWITYVQIPYLIWVSFAAVLQLTITVLNRKRNPSPEKK